MADFSRRHFLSVSPFFELCLHNSKNVDRKYPDLHSQCSNIVCTADDIEADLIFIEELICLLIARNTG